jgi:GAF domain-containing protein
VAVPLIVEGHVIGVLDMQSDQVGTFTEHNLTVFEAMATQLSISIDSARQWSLAQEAQQKSVETLRQFTREAWAEKLTREKRDFGFAYDLASIRPLKSKRKNGGVAVPVRVQTEEIGYISVEKPAERPWSTEEQLLMEAVAQQLGQKAENLRLFEQTQQRAAREQVARQISDKIRASRDIDTALRTAAEELSRALGAAKAVVDLKMSPESGPEEDDASRQEPPAELTNLVEPKADDQ